MTNVGATAIVPAYRPTGSLFWLLTRNAFLTLFTLGFYRFWAKTRLRQFFWSGIHIGDEPLEYTGRGVELFVGFLIVIAILAPVTIAWSAVQYALAANSSVVFVGQFVYLAVLGVLYSAAVFRARRYRLSRTMWRGIRAAQGGSTWRYIGRSVLWGLASVITLGLAGPWMRTALQRYRTENTIIGDRALSFNAKASPLFWRWMLFLATAVIGWGGMVAFFYSMSAAGNAGRLSEHYRSWVAFGESTGSWPIFLVVGCAVIAPFAYVAYRVKEFRHFTAHTRLNDVTFTSRLRTWTPVGRLALFSVVLVVIYGVGTVSLFVLSQRNADLFARGDFPGVVTLFVFFAIIVVGFLFTVRILWTMVVTAGLIERICSTLEIGNVAALDALGQAPAGAQKYGEGLADGFEIGFG